jgi:ubiquinone/menaquinone biosynthesis C-methylase UbiE
MDLRQRFEGLGEQYQKFRPTYPAELLDWLLDLARPARVVDLGCGTGIAMNLLAERGVSVIGVDPSADMLAQARGLRVRGDAMRLPFRGGAFDLAYAAQSFHWFETDVALAEIARVVRPGGWSCAFWNLRTQSPFHVEYEHILRTFSSEYPGLRQRGRRAVGTLESRVIGPRATFPHIRRMTLAELIGYAHSASYVALGVTDNAGFDAALGALFARHCHADAIDFDYETVAQAWQPG